MASRLLSELKLKEREKKIKTETEKPERNSDLNRFRAKKDPPNLSPGGSLVPSSPVRSVVCCSEDGE